MKNLTELRKERAQVVKDMDALTKVEDFTDEQRAEFDELESRASALDSDIERLEKVEARKVHLAKPAPTNEPEVRIEIGDGPQDRGFSSLEDNISAILRASIPGGRIDERLRPAEIDPNARVLGADKRAASGMSEGTGAYGGFLLQNEYANDLLDPMFETGVLVSRVRQHVIKNPAANSVTFNVLDETDRGRGYRLGGLRLYTREEASTVTASKPKLREWEIKTRSVMGICYFTEEQMQDTPGIVGLVENYFRNEAGYELDEYILNGDGASEPLGITNHSALISVTAESGQVADSLVPENFSKMYSRMPARCRANAIWTHPANALPELMGLTMDVGTGGVPLWIPGNSIAGAPYSTILGKPLLELEQSVTVGDANDIMFIDPTQYMLVRKGGARADLSMHVQFLYGEWVLRFMFRIGGGSWWSSAITPANDGDTLGPFIGLGARA